MLWRRSGLVLWILVAAPAAAGGPQQQMPMTSALEGSPAIKLQVNPSSSAEIRRWLADHAAARGRPAGESNVYVEIFLADRDNVPVPAPRDIPIEIEARSSSGQSARSLVTLGAGTTTSKYQIPVGTPGLVEIRARHPELREGGTFAVAVPPGALEAPSVGSESAPPRRPPAQRTPCCPPPQDGTLRPPSSPQSSLMRPGVRLVALGVPPTPVADVTGAVSSPASSPTSSPAVTVALRLSNAAPMADGRDRAKLEAVVVSPPGGLARELRIQVFASAGALSSQKIVIPAGEMHGAVFLTSSQIGPVTIEYMAADQPVVLEGERKLSALFRSAVSSIELSAPSQVSLFDQAELVATFLDHDRKTVSTDTERTVRLFLTVASAQVDPAEIVFGKGKFSSRAALLPTWPGDVTVVAQSEALKTVTTPVRVVVPSGFLVLVFAGGLVGGALAFLAGGEDRRWWRIPLGAVTGAALVWAALFMNVQTVLPRAVILNPASLAVVAALGGWAGIHVFALLAGRFGLRV